MDQKLQQVDFEKQSLLINCDSNAFDCNYML